jgi:hypothetical protein
MVANLRAQFSSRQELPILIPNVGLRTTPGKRGNRKLSHYRVSQFTCFWLVESIILIKLFRINTRKNTAKMRP